MWPCGHDGAARRASSMFSLGFILHRQHFFPSDDVSKRQRISKLFQKCHLIHTHRHIHTHTQSVSLYTLQTTGYYMPPAREIRSFKTASQTDDNNSDPASNSERDSHTEAWAGRGKSQSPSPQRRLAPENTCCT